MYCSPIQNNPHLLTPLSQKKQIEKKNPVFIPDSGWVVSASRELRRGLLGLGVPGVVLLLLPLDLLLLMLQMLVVVEGIRVEGWRGGILGRGRASAEVLLLLAGARGVESGRSIRGRRRR